MKREGLEEVNALFEVGRVLVGVVDDLGALARVVLAHARLQRVAVPPHVFRDVLAPLLLGVEGVVEPVDGTVRADANLGSGPHQL